MHSSLDELPASPSAPIDEAHRCHLDLSEALTELYRAGGRITIGDQEHPDFRSAMIAALERTPSRRKAIAARVSLGLGDRYNVSTAIDRSLWGYLQDAHHNGNGNGRSH